jgi:hypothetical protein
LILGENGKWVDLAERCVQWRTWILAVLNLLFQLAEAKFGLSDVELSISVKRKI